MTRRRILAVVAAGLALVIGGLFLAVALIPEERVARAVADRAEAFLGQPVAIEKAGISLLPLPGVRLDGLSVGKPDSTALARVDRVDLRIRLLPLIQRRVVVRSLDLEQPRISVEIDSTGIANFPVLESDTTGEPAGDIAFAVERIRVTDGAIRYSNQQDGARVRLDGWGQQLSLSGAVEGGALASLSLTGWVSFDDVATDLPGAVLPTRDLQLRVQHDATLDLDADRLDLRTLQVSFDGVEVAGSGRVEGVNSGRPYVRLDLSADNIDAARLMDWVPDSARARMALAGRPLTLDGSATLQATVDGTVAPDTLPAVDGALNLVGLNVAAGEETLARDIGGLVAFSLDSVVVRIDGQALGESFNAGIAVRDPEMPTAVVAVSGRGDMARLAGLGLVSDTLGLGGYIQVDLRGQVPVRSPADSRFAGSVRVLEGRLMGVQPVVLVPVANARFDGGQVRINPFGVLLGPDQVPIELDVTVDGWIPAAVDSTAPPPTVAVAMNADTLDLDALLGPSESGYPSLLFARLANRSVQGRPPEEIARELGLSIPPLPPVEASVAARIGQLVRNDLRYDDMQAYIRLSQGSVSLDSLRFGIMGGTVEGNGRLEPRVTESGEPAGARLMGRFSLTNVGAGPFFDALTPFRDHLKGRLDLIATMGMDLDQYALPERSSVAANGALAIAEGSLTNWTVLQSVSDRLGLAGFDTLWFRDWAGSFQIDGPRVDLAETALQGQSLDARTAGWFDFAGQLDLEVIADLTADLASRAGAIGEQVLATVQDGRVPVGLHIRGSVEQPEVNLDLSPARDAVASRVEAEAREAGAAIRDAARAAGEQVAGDVRERAGQLIGDSTGTFTLPDSLKGLPADSLRQVLGDSLYTLLPDSVKLRADSLQQAIQNALRERLRRLLPGRGGGQARDTGTGGGEASDTGSGGGEASDTGSGGGR